MRLFTCSLLLIATAADAQFFLPDKPSPTGRPPITEESLKEVERTDELLLISDLVRCSTVFELAGEYDDAEELLARSRSRLEQLYGALGSLPDLPRIGWGENTFSLIEIYETSISADFFLGRLYDRHLHRTSRMILSSTLEQPDRQTNSLMRDAAKGFLAESNCSERLSSVGVP